MLAQKSILRSLKKTQTKSQKQTNKQALLSNLAKQAITDVEALLFLNYFLHFRTCSYSLRKSGCITISWIPTRSTEASNSYC